MEDDDDDDDEDDEEEEEDDDDDEEEDEEEDYAMDEDEDEDEVDDDEVNQFLPLLSLSFCRSRRLAHFCSASTPMRSSHAAHVESGLTTPLPRRNKRLVSSLGKGRTRNNLSPTPDLQCSRVNESTGIGRWLPLIVLLSVCCIEKRGHLSTIWL